MISVVMDPNLELEQLAAEAINYQATQHLHRQEQQRARVEPIQYNVDGKFTCPFATCLRPYKRKDLLKRHLTTLLASPDENHQDPVVWEQVRESAVMTVYTRPRNLTEEQKKQRRKESNLRHRLKYAEELKEKRNRRRRLEKLLEGVSVGVQTPDWEAESKENAMTLPVPVLVQNEIQTTSRPPVVRPPALNGESIVSRGTRRMPRS